MKPVNTVISNTGIRAQPTPAVNSVNSGKDFCGTLRPRPDFPNSFPLPSFTPFVRIPHASKRQAKIIHTVELFALRRREVKKNGYEPERREFVLAACLCAKCWLLELGRKLQ